MTAAQQRKDKSNSILLFENGKNGLLVFVFAGEPPEAKYEKLLVFQWSCRVGRDEVVFGWLKKASSCAAGRAARLWLPPTNKQTPQFSFNKQKRENGANNSTKERQLKEINEINWIWVEWSWVDLRNGAPTASGRRQAPQQLHQSTIQWRLIVELLMEGLLLLSIKWVMSRRNSIN